MQSLIRGDTLRGARQDNLDRPNRYIVSNRRLCTLLL